MDGLQQTRSIDGVLGLEDVKRGLYSLIIENIVAISNILRISV